MSRLEEIRKRLFAAQRHEVFPLVDQTGQKYYGRRLDFAGIEAKGMGPAISLWHITYESTPSQQELQGFESVREWQAETCDSHWESQADSDLAEFFLHADTDMEHLIIGLKLAETNRQVLEKALMEGNLAEAQRVFLEGKKMMEQWNDPT